MTMGNCMSNSGKFEPPGQKAVDSFVLGIDKENDPRWRALRDAQLRAELAEQAQAVAKPSSVVRPKGPKCSICKGHVSVSINPWQRTRGDLLAAELTDDSDAESDNTTVEGANGISSKGKAKKRDKLEKHGIELKPCQHVFCGACLAQAIYKTLNVAFNPSSYGTKLPPTPTPPLSANRDFPMSCPSCQPKPGEALVEIGDVTARLVLGDCNMDAWQHARFASKLDLIYCPYKGCYEPFDANDVLPAPQGVSNAATLVQCPRCRRALCKACKVPWHQKLTCEQYEALPADERSPEDLALTELAKRERWKRCPKCGAMVELKFGCNHITCKCKHHFCYKCGANFEYKDGKYRCTGGKGCKIWDEEALLARD